MITPDKLESSVDGFSDFKIKEKQKEEKAAVDVVIDNPADFREALGQAQMAGIDHMVVSQKMFAYLSGNKDTPWINYGDPCVKVYAEGTKDYHDSNEGLSPDRLISKMKSEGKL